MKFHLWPLIFILSSSVIASAEDDGTLVAPGFELPTDANAVILIYDRSGGMLVDQRRQALLSISAAGIVTITDPTSVSLTHQGILAPDELQALLSFILTDQSFLSLQTDSINTEIKAVQQQTGKMFVVADAPTTSISIELPAYQHQVQFYALDMMSRQYPEIASLQNLRAVQSRLQQLINDVYHSAD